MKYLSFITLLIIIACQPLSTDPAWKVILKTSRDGYVTIGSKEDLINAIRQGVDIKVGWGHRGKTRTIEHLSNPIWIGILDEHEVIAHIHPQVLSNIDWQNRSSSYEGKNKLNEEWRVVISTKGTFDAVWIDRINSEVIKRIPQNHPITWFAKEYVTEKIAMPLFE